MKYKFNPQYDWLHSLFLSVLDYIVVWIELNDIATAVATTGSFRLNLLFPYPSTMIPFIIWIALFILRLQRPLNSNCSTPQKCIDWIFSFVFSISLVVFHSLWKCTDLSLISATTISKILSCFSVFGFTVLIQNLLLWFHFAYDSLMQSTTSLPTVWKNHPFLFPFVLIFLLWLPFAVWNYPAGMSYDGFYQLYRILGFQPLTNHWPVSSSVIFGICYTAGKTVFGSVSAGLFTIVLCQMLFCASCFAYSLKTMRQMQSAPSLMILTLAFYCAFPIVFRYCISLNKDCWFACTLLLCVSYCAKCLQPDHKWNWKSFAIWSFLSLLVCILRSNGPHVMLLWSIPFLIAWIIKRKRLFLQLFCGILCAFVICIGYLNILLPLLDIPGASVAESLSIPFMQTARYAKYHPEDITNDEKTIIGNVLDFDNLPSLYAERISDPVKSTYHGTKDDLIPYFGVWIKQGLRHPDTYIIATLNNIYGFFYPGASEGSPSIYTNCSWEPAFIDLNEQELADRDQRLVGYFNYINTFENFPPFFLLSNTALHIWLLIYMAISTFFRKKYIQTLLFLPSLVSVLVCIASPTFSYSGIRYALPIIFLNLFLFNIYAYSYHLSQNTDSAILKYSQNSNLDS